MATCNEYLVCPFDKAHRILKSRMQTHIVKCKKNFPCSTLKECPFNPLHWVEEVEYQYHLKNCEDSLIMNSLLFSLEPTQQVGNVSLEEIKNLTEGIECSEDWDNEPPALSTYDPYKNIENRNIVIPLIVESKAKRKQFRQDQRHRFANIPDRTLDTTTDTQKSFLDMCSEEPLRRPHSVQPTPFISHKKNKKNRQYSDRLSSSSSSSSSCSSSSSTSNVKGYERNLPDDLTQFPINKKSNKEKITPHGKNQGHPSKHEKASNVKLYSNNNNEKQQNSDKISLNTTYDVNDCKNTYYPLIDESGQSDTTVLINDSLQNRSGETNHDIVTSSDILSKYNNQMEVLLKAEANISAEKMKLTAQMTGALQNAQLKNPFSSDTVANPRCAANFSGSNQNTTSSTNKSVTGKQFEKKLEILKNRFGLSNTSLYDPNSSISTINTSQYLSNESQQSARNFNPNASFFTGYEEEGPSGIDLDNTDGFITKK